ncbi:MAG TPA: DNA-directed RNA polymerase subunit beta' [Thermoleophilia bacterium]|mgnify:CR=1 FL=1|nr:DNA-directed RNA polymerase subunit beta' [Thermoleophilia bacterium]HQG02850.1 DNA-directed RNA polymerase subunit beta' [Thermoleophilia bacterium]HQJ97932.1 DNA-directed RNA polymerase subunit beta' [Thermoleophilia bacterium]
MIDINNFDSIRIGLASPKQIEAWSKGEVTKPETINYRTLKPERDGLFCERIFGPTKDWECYCGKYKRVRYKGIICERCGVEVTRAKVRRERMGHIKLAAPVSHIWFFKGVPSRMGYLLDIAPKELEKVLYFGGSYVVVSVDKERRENDLVYLQEKVDELKARYDVYADDRERAIRAMHDEVVEVLDGARGADDFHTGAEPEDEFGFFNYFDIYESYRRIVVGAAALGSDELRLQRAKTDKLADDYIDRGRKAVEQAKGHVDRAWEQFKTIDARDVIGDELLYQQMERMFAREAGYEPESLGVYFTGGTGAEAVRELLKRVDLEAEADGLRDTIHTAKGQRQARAVKRLKVVSAFLRSGNRPEWMVLDVIPVIPPELRPMVQLDGGRFATSDLNDLYRRVINRNNRLKRLLDLQAPDIIVNNEKRMLQEAVDALFDNGRRGRAVTGPGNRALKSLSDMLKGKQGRFRQNLLGKRVDYSGRSVIVAGPHLKMHQCGLPKMMALELFKPFIMSRLVARKMVQNIKAAKKMVESMVPEVWDILEEVINEHPVMLNRAPTLHRLGIQAFEPLLVEGKAIQIHPLVCAAFNADFDGDQMAVHLPLSWEAQAEARTLMLSTNNILSPAHGRPIAVPSQDMVIGVYYLTYHDKDDLSGAKPEDFDAPLPAFSGYDEVARAYEQRILDQRQVPSQRAAGIAEFTRRPIRLRLADGERIVTTVGRALFNQRVEEGLREVLGDDFCEDDYRFHNRTITKKGLSAFINELVATHGATKVARMLDVFKDVGFEYATRAAVTVSKNDIVIPEREKAEILARHDEMVDAVQRQYNDGLLTPEERRSKIEEIWREADVQITAATQANFDPLNPIYMMATSGARGDIKQIRQLAGWRGQMANPKGEIVEQPVKSSFIEGLSVLEFFVSTHGARKGLADTALRTADSGYLTRRLVDVCQDVTVSEEDCGTTAWVPMSPWSRRREENPLLKGCALAESVKRPRSDRVVLSKGTKIGPAQLGLLREVFAEMPNAKVKVTHGGKGAAEALAVWTHEPNENLLGRHLGAPIVDEATGEIVYDRDALIDPEARDGILDVLQRSAESDPMVPVRSVLTCEAEIGVCQKCYGHSLANNAAAEIGDAVGHIAAQSIGEPGTQLTMRTFHTGGIAGADITHGLPRVVELFEARKPKGVARIAEVSGRVAVEDTERGVKVTIHPEEGAPKEYLGLHRGHLLVEDGDWVDEGAPLTPGSLYPADLLRHAGPTATERYLVNEVQEVYRSQGVEINDKHVELIVRQMMKKMRVVTAGDTVFLPGQLVDRHTLRAENQRVAEEGGEEAEAEDVILGITKASLATESFLSAASFQETTKVLTDAAIEGTVDYLQGLKENVIIGKLIPAGTGLRRYRDIEIFPAERARALEAADRFMSGESAWTGEAERDWTFDD